MRSLMIGAAVLLILPLLPGCTEQNEPTAATTINPLTANYFDLAGRPEVAGFVLRGEGTAAVGFMDGENALVSVHSTSYPPIPWFGDCGPTTDIEPLYWQDVLSPSGKWHELWIAPKAFVAVYDLAGPGVGTCDYWNNVTGMLLAEGQVQWMYVDNDLTGGAAYGGTGGNVWQLKASGKVTNVVTGQSHGYHVMRKWHLLPDETFLTSGAGPQLNPDPR